MKIKLMVLCAALVGCASTSTEPAQNASPSAASQNSDALSREATRGGGVAKSYGCGTASYYADSLAGNSTASGEPYDPGRFTAAHKTLAFGTRLRVVRAGVGEVEVVVNDRGPFTPGRIIDLSRAAAERLDLISAGVAEVCLYAK